MIEQLGFCQGIENYSRHFTGRNPGEAPPTLLEYFPEKFKEDCIEKSIEYKVMKLAQEGEFAEIGTRVKMGAEAYHLEAVKLGKPNYRFITEYNEILQALQVK